MTIPILTLMAAGPADAGGKGPVRVGSPEHAVKVPGPVPLPGKLRHPDGKGSVPGVLLLAGSGPQDADGTLAPNHPLRDLADGLCARGIASLRYDKRTLAAPRSRIATVADEVTTDAQAALALLASEPHIGPIFILGHDLGGYLAPRVAAGKKVAGIILLGVSPRSLATQLVDQAVAAMTGGADGKPLPMAAEQLAAARRTEHEIERPDLKASDVVDLFGVPTPATYWLDLRGYDPVAATAALGRPALVLFADHDEFVSAADRARWSKSVTGPARITTRTFAGLNHLFLPVPPAPPAGAPPLEDPYSVPGTIPADVLDAIAAFIKR